MGLWLPDGIGRDNQEPKNPGKGFSGDHSGTIKPGKGPRGFLASELTGTTIRLAGRLALHLLMRPRAAVILVIVLEILIARSRGRLRLRL